MYRGYRLQSEETSTAVFLPVHSFFPGTGKRRHQIAAVIFLWRRPGKLQRLLPPASTCASKAGSSVFWVRSYQANSIFP